jgi:outer membrane protein
MNFKQFVSALFVVCALLPTTLVRAQVKPISLSDYLQAALKYNPLIGSAEQARASAGFNSEAVQKSYCPQIGVGSHLIFAPGYDQAVTNGGEFGAQIMGSYTIYDGGMRSYEIQKGKVGVEQGTVNQNKTRADIIYAVSTAFIAAVKEKRELAISEQGYDLLRNYLQLVKQLQASGQGSETDVLKTTVDLNNAMIDIDARRVAFKNSLLTLSQATGLPVNEVTDVDSSMISIPYDSTFNEEKNIDIASLELALKQAELEAQVVGARLGPTLSLGADAGALTSLPNIMPGYKNILGASVGIAVSMPLFTFGSIEDNYNAAEASAKSVSLQNDYSRILMERDFEGTRNDVANAESQIAALKSNLVVAERNLLLSKARYAGGSGISLEVLDAIQMVNQIKLAIEEANARMASDILKLNRLDYTGVNQE